MFWLRSRFFMAILMIFVLGSMQVYAQKTLRMVVEMPKLDDSVLANEIFANVLQQSLLRSLSYDTRWNVHSAEVAALTAKQLEESTSIERHSLEYWNNLGYRLLLSSRISPAQESIAGLQLWLIDTGSGQIYSEIWMSVSLDQSFNVQCERVANNLAVQLSRIPDERLASPIPPMPDQLRQGLYVTGLDKRVTVKTQDDFSLGTVYNQTLSLDHLSIRERRSFSLKFSRPGYYDRVVTYNPAKNVQKLIAPELYPVSRLRQGIHVDLSSLTYSYDYRYLPVPDWWWIGYRIGIASRGLLDYEPGCKDLILLIPDFSIGTGFYIIHQPSEGVRLHVSTRYGFISSMRSDFRLSPSMDWYWTPLNLGVEVNFPWFTLQHELGYRYWLGSMVSNTNLYPQGYVSAYPQIGIAILIKGGSK
jgi:hypothetical protein